MASNFPNMSYCAFENTSNAMDQVAGMVEAALESREPLLDRGLGGGGRGRSSRRLAETGRNRR